MRPVLILLTVLDLALAALLVGVSGFVLEGVNGEGAMMPEAIFFWLMLGACLIAPTAAWWLRSRQVPGGAVLALAAAPLVVAVLVLVLEPVFV